MQTIKEHLKKNQFARFYLLFGSEAYLVRWYKNQLKKGILPEGDEMNFSHFEGEDIDISEVIGIGQTLPFFAEKRLILIENSKLFKSQNDLADVLSDFPESTTVLFAEKEVDKRNKLYKTVSKLGVAAEMSGMPEKELIQWISMYLKRVQKKITIDNARYLIDKSGSDMVNLSNELDKIISFALDKETIEKTDIDEICVTQISGKIFEMIDAVANKKQRQALALYYDLLTLKERPASILYLFARHFNILLQLKELRKKRISDNEAAKILGVPYFAISKYNGQAGNFESEKLLEMLKECTELEELIKTGRLNDQIAVEMFIVKYTV